ncbi:sporulation protein YqfD [Clostridium neuense]|uniref:Sporulation protein YqfD n=1 Tax=Clostridium neuense TaxID=1728934 RepID=A0ABW8THC3_9CLOT
MKIKFEKTKNAYITVEVRTKKIEEFLNLLWKNKIKLIEVHRIDMNLIRIEVELRDYRKIKELASKTKSRIKIIKTRGIGFFLIKLKNRFSLVIGVAAFIFLIHYLASFIWGIDISTERNVPPYNIRMQLYNLGIRPGINKSSLNVYDIEKKLALRNNDIMWARVRIYGSHLKVNIAERQEPPQIVNDTNPCDIVAGKDGYVLRVYTKSGTAAVKTGDVVKKGQVLIKGEQGKEGSTYSVHAEGSVIAQVSYEKSVDVSLSKHVRVRTGREMENYYIKIGNKKIYLKKSANKFKKYDRIIDDNFFFKKETYYEVKDKLEKQNKEKLVNSEADEMYKKITSKFDKNIKIINKSVDTTTSGDLCTIRILVVTEENIGAVQ